jgi:predicted GNAT family acetyltransferase
MLPTGRYHARVEIRRLHEPRGFLELARPLLAPDRETEARHNLILGVAGTAAERPDLYAAFRAWVALEHGEPAAAASRTPPFGAILAEPRSAPALLALVDALAEDEPDLPGFVGNEPHVHRAAERWTERTGAATSLLQRHGVYALTEVHEVPHPAGAPRPATPADRDLVLGWLLDFAEEVPVPGSGDPGFLERVVDARLGNGWWWLWEDGEPVSLASCSAPTPTGIRIGPVYTPPEHRRHGYATALVAELSRRLLAEGHRACYLYADLANPISNAIYERIGYRRVADSAEISFVRDPR